MSPRDILRRSGAGQGSLYHHFSGKKALAVIALEGMAEQQLRQFDRLLNSGDRPLPERLQAALSEISDPAKGCPLGNLVVDVAVDDAELRAPIEVYFQRLEALVLQALLDSTMRGEFHTGEPIETIARTLLAVHQGGLILSRLHQDRSYLDETAAVVMSLTSRLFFVDGASTSMRYVSPVAALGV